MHSTVYNRRNIDCSNEIITLHVSLEQGTCKKDEEIYLADEFGTALPTQWEDDRTVNFRYEKNIGRYEDGSLKNGVISFIDSIPAASSKQYKLGVKTKSDHAQTQNFSRVAGDDPMYPTGFEYVFLDQYKHECSIFDVATIKKTCAIKESGPIFTETEEVYEMESTLEVTVRYRYYANGQRKIYFYSRALRELKADEILGMYGVLRHIPAKGKLHGKETDQYTCLHWKQGDSLLCAGIDSVHGDRPRTDFSNPHYPSFSEIIEEEDDLAIQGGWRYGAGSKHFAISEGEVFAGSFYLDASLNNKTLSEKVASNVVGLVSRVVTDPNSKKKLELLLRELLVKVGGHYYRAYGGSKSAGENPFSVAYCGNLMLAQLTEDLSFAQAVHDLDQMCMAYGAHLGGAEMLKRYKQGELGYQFTSRIFPGAWLCSQICQRKGELATVERMNDYLRAYAEMSCLIVEEEGATRLEYAHPDIVSNSIGAGMRALAMGLSLEPDNERWRIAFIQNKSNFRLFHRYSDTIVADSTNSNISHCQYLHYALFAFNEYIKCIPFAGMNNELYAGQYGWMGFNSAGSAKEQLYCISSSRRGASHTNAYQIAILINEKTDESFEEACAIAGRLLEQVNKDGSHFFPLEQWPYDVSQKYEGAVPFELGILAESLFELKFRLDRKE